MTVQKLEAIKGGGGSIRVGTTGTVGALMTRELDSMKASPRTPTSRCNGAIPVSVDCGPSTPRRTQPRKSSDEASSSRTSNINHFRTPKGYTKSTHRLPMLGSDNVSVNGTPRREKRTNNIVEIVDVKCGNPDRAWASPITSKLKKLGFSKLSESII